MPKKKKNGNGQSWASKLEALEQAVERMGVSSGLPNRRTARNRRRRIRQRQRRREGNVGRELTGSGEMVQPLRVGAVGRRSCYNPGEGEILLSRLELVATVKLAANKTEGAGYFDMVPPSFKFLSGLSDKFDRIKWLSCEFVWTTATGALAPGVIAFGMDWGFSLDATTTVTSVAACTPTYTHALRKEMSALQVPANRLQSRAWYLITNTSTTNIFDRSPGRYVYAYSSEAKNSEQNLGVIFCRYEVVLSGTR